MLPCNEGPYVWDKKSQYTDRIYEGIGSIFQHRTHSFIAKHFLKAKWIGSLINGHQPQEGDQSTYFGLSTSDCDQNSLKIHENKQSLNFVYVPNTNKTRIHHVIKTTTVTNKTVFVYDWERVDEAHNFVKFDESFRNHFHEKRMLRQTPKRELDEYWVSIHFRWGDVETSDPNKPDQRAGLSFTDYCRCIRYILYLKPHVKIFLFAENFTRVDMCKELEKPNVHLFNDSNSWKRDLDITSQSQLLIGGSSSFFVLGAHLCGYGSTVCTVIHSSGMKFAESAYEKRIPKHLNTIPCQTSYRCYRKSIQELLQMDH